MGPLDGSGALKIRNGSSHLQNPVVRPRRKPQPLGAQVEKTLPRGIQGAAAHYLPGTHGRIAMDLGTALESVLLPSPGSCHPGTHGGGKIPLGRLRQSAGRWGPNLHLQVHTIFQWTGHPTPISSHGPGVALTATGFVGAREATGAYLRCLFAMSP